MAPRRADGYYARMDRYRSFSLLIAAAVVGNLALSGCEPKPRTLELTSSLTGQPLQNVLLLMELRAYEEQNPEYVMGDVFQQNRIDRYVKDNHGWGSPVKHSFGPGVYINRQALSEMPIQHRQPDRLTLAQISSGWEIYRENLAWDNETSWIARAYFLFKPHTLPVMLTPEGLDAMADRHGKVHLSLQPERVGTRPSDLRVINATCEVLAILPSSTLDQGLQHRLLSDLAGPLKRIVAFPADPPPYEDFPAFQARAKKLLDRLDSLAPGSARP